MLNGKETPIRDSNNLRSKYMEQCGRFVLQDKGNEFFEDIRKATDGLDNIDINVITTKLDYDDFEQMAEYYNKGQEEFEIKPHLVKELPDMKETFQKVRNYGTEAADTLMGKKALLMDDLSDRPAVRSAAESFAKTIDEKVGDIRGKVKNMDDSNVNLCFAGVYSSGKSALINALIGYRILPESIKSATAKMFRISSPARGESVQVSFLIDNIAAKLEWNDDDKRFEFTEWPNGNDNRAKIQEKLNEVKAKRQHEQLLALLCVINSMGDGEKCFGESRH